MKVIKQKTIDFYANLSYEEQRRFLTALQAVSKKPPYYIAFKLDSIGLVKLGKVTEYCKQHNIDFRAEKSGKTAVRFRFNGLEERNAVLIGQMTK